MTEPASLSRLRRSRAGHRASVTKAIAKAEEEIHGTPGGPRAFRLRQLREALQEKRQTLEKINKTILAEVEEEELETEIDDIDVVKERIQLCIQEIEDHLTPAQTARVPNSTPEPPAKSPNVAPDQQIPPQLPDVPATGASRVTASKVKLPKLTLEKFDGTPTKWLAFWSQFKSTIHDNPSLSEVDKFSYLRSYIEGKAADAIAGMVLIPRNYQQAVEKLQRRFGDTGDIVSRHMRSLLQMPPVKSHLDLEGLRKLIDTVESDIASLTALGETEATYGGVVTTVIMDSLPPEIRLTIGRQLGEDTKDVNKLIQAIDKEIVSREKFYTQPSQLNEKIPPPPRRSQPTAAAFLTNTQNLCIFCGKDHQPETCTKIPEPSARSSFLMKQGRCFNCLRRSHLSRECRSKDRCQHCRGKHHTAVCRQGERAKPTNTRAQGGGGQHQERTANQLRVRNPTPPPAPSNTLLAAAASHVLLQTAVVRIYRPGNSPSNYKEIRAVLDGGSQRTYMSERVAKELHLPSKRIDKISIKTFGDKEGDQRTCEVVDFTLKTRYKEDLDMEALVTPVICDPLSQQPTKRARDKHQHLRGLRLADPNDVDDTLPVDLLIGADFYWSMVTGTIRRGRSGPTAIQTRVGWVLSGPTGEAQATTTTNLIFTSTHLLEVHTTPLEDTLDATLERFWDLETMGIRDDDMSVQEKFSQSIKLQDGRYEVSLPWKPTHRPLPRNLQLCTKRLHSLIKKLQLTPQVLTEYDKIMKEQLSKGILEDVPESEIAREDGVHYLPHHGVIRADKATTKLRVVYDASAKTGSHPSLNECLYAGPSFDQSILDIVLKFRRHTIAMTADIEKAFLMISVAPEDRDALRLLWTPDITADQPTVKHYRFTRVVFGVKCSPFLLNATVRHHISQFQEQDPEFVKAFLSSIYVDDLSFGAENETAAYQLFSKAKTRLAEAGFNLRKFFTNSHLLQSQIDSQEEDTTTPTTAEDDQTFAKVSLGVKGEKSEGEAKESKILGVTWRREEDKLVFTTDKLEESLREKTPTKRHVVGIAAAIFDPMGVMSPATVLWKMLFQSICKSGVAWDEPLAGEQLKEWNRLKTAMGERVELSIQRCYGVTRNQKARIIGFCDASERAYAAVAYLRIEEEEGEARVQFVASKTRVAPVKTQTIPRLELMSALLLARLCETIEGALKGLVDLEETVCFTDSRVALCWIQGVDQEWKQFVENRSTTIRQKIPATNWSHCPGTLNPADIPSRGMLLPELKKETKWLEGPEWLKRQLKPTCEKPGEVPEECWMERKKRSHTLITISEKKHNLSQLIDSTKFSGLRRLLGVTAMVLKFIYLCKRERREHHDLIKEAQLLWLKETQAEIQSSQDFSNLRRQLNLTLDPSSLWRCAGRLSNSDLPEEARRPILIGRNHHLTRLLIRDAHQRVLHNGCKETLTELRMHYWLVRGRQIVKREIYKCPVCRRYEGRPFRSRPSPPLPEFRVQRSRPFATIGVDFAGPLYIRGREGPKTWICLFSCCCTRAIHLELVSDLTTEAFIRSLKRFSSRRGVPEVVISDNAKTFQSADRILQDLLKSPDVQQCMEGKVIKWRFNTEKAPWQGGFFERMVQSAKRCLKKSLGRNLLTFEELLTLITEVEGVLNSRPLSYVEEKDTEEALTPSHLVTGYRILNLPDPTMPTNNEEEDFMPTPEKLNGRMRRLANIQAHFWERWKREYLQELREHHRWQRNSTGIDRTPLENEPVIIYDEDHPRGLWRLGRVTETIRSADGEIRAAKVKTLSKTGSSKILRRPIQHLYPLEARQTNPQETESQGSTPEQLGRSTQEEQDPTLDETRNSTLEEPQHSFPDGRSTTTSRPKREAARRARVHFQSMAEQNLI